MRPLVGALALALPLGLALPSGAAEAARTKTTRVSGWSTQALVAKPGQTVRLQLAVRPAKATKPRTVLLQRRASGSSAWSTAVVGRTGKRGVLTLRVPTARSFDGAVRLRVLGTRKARTLVTPSRRLVVRSSVGSAAGSVPATTATEAQVAALVNVARSSGRYCGSQWYPAQSPLRIDNRLSKASRDHAYDMGRRGYFSHTSYDGRSPWDRAEAAGYPDANGENIAAGQDSPAAVMDSWLDSPGHCANIMSSSAREIGVGYADVDGSPYGSYWVQMFGRG